MSNTSVENQSTEPAGFDETTALLEALSTVAELRSDLDDARALMRRLEPGLFRPATPLDQMIRRLDHAVDRRDPEGADRQRSATMGELDGLVNGLPAVVDRLQLLTQLL